MVAFDGRAIKRPSSARLGLSDSILPPHCPNLMILRIHHLERRPHFLFECYVCAVPIIGLYSVLFFHIAQSTAASFLASATTAFLLPCLSKIVRAHVFKRELRLVRKSAFAAIVSAWRACRLPCFVIRPFRCVERTNPSRAVIGIRSYRCCRDGR